MSASVDYLAEEIISLIKAFHEDPLNASTCVRNKIQALVKPKDEALAEAWNDLLGAAEGYAPYPWNHEDNPFCKTLVKIGEALDLPPWTVHPANVDPFGLTKIEPPLCRSLKEKSSSAS